MTKQIQTRSSTAAAGRNKLRLLLRSTVTASLVVGLSAIASAQTATQTELAMPAFPFDASSLSLPVSQDAFLPHATPNATCKKTTSHRASILLGLKKCTSTNIHAPALAPSTTAPNFPSTEPAPSLYSSSGRSSTVADNETVVLASAQELTNEYTIADSSDEQFPAPEALTSDEASEEESLIDIEFPMAAPAPVAQSGSRLPELVKRPPAMQLHIGSASNRSVSSVSNIITVEDESQPAPQHQPELTPANFSLSDSDEHVQLAITKTELQPSLSVAVQPTISDSTSNVMNVQIEGEPISGKALSRAMVSKVPSNTPQTTAAGSVLTESSSRNAATHKSVSDKVIDNSPTVGERLEVGLHEATNVETMQPISGLSIEHPELCQVLKSGERMISLVGLKAGQTRVALFTTNESGERKIEIREVMIAGTESRQADMKSMAIDISRSVHNMYPKSRIEVIAEEEGLTVQGYASTEDEARKIISLVRRTSLQPVVDRLATYK